MTKQFRMVAILAVLASVAVGAATSNFPQGRRPGGGRPPFSALDANKDGKISSAEWQGSADLFDRIDANDDNIIDQAEWNSAVPTGDYRRGDGPFGQHLLGALDTNADGSVSQSEFDQITNSFDTLDLDKDGALNIEELGRFPHAIGNRRPEPDRAERKGPPSFAELDVNADKKISRDEWRGPEPAFARIDSNGDGFIDEAELTAGPQRLPRGGPAFMGERLLSFFDSNGDAKVSREEFSKLTGLFDSLDRDESGSLSATEIGQLFRVAGGPGR